MFVVLVIERSGSFVGVGGSKNGTFLMNPSRVIVIVADRIDTLPTGVAFSTLVDGCKRIQSRVDGYQSAAARAGSIGRFPRLHNLTAIGAEDISRVLTHGARRNLACPAAAVFPGVTGSTSLVLPSFSEPEENEGAYDRG